MDTLDNANATNPFVNSNNPDIIGQKEGFVLNLADGCKQNGTENVTDFVERSANGKRSAAIEFDEDEDLGPETDVDCIDEMSFSPSPLHAKSHIDEIVNNNPIEEYCDSKEEKAALEMSSKKFGDFEALREETPTPPADSVHDTSGLVDNVADSGEESEDEWNYIKGDQAEKENIDPSESDKKISDLDLDLESDTMSQLNPNAAEFVPTSPKRDVTSPAYQALVDDLVIAQSPKRFTSNDIDIKVPNPQEFETEIKTRPGDLIESSNKDESDNGHNLSSQEIMENLLNGRPIEEIEFQPSLAKPSEFHFGPNSTPFSTPGKFMDQSTKAVVDDESNYLNESFNEDLQDLNKDENCMSMSFYQDDEETNDLDLNKVQVLPENIDEFLEKPKDVENVCQRALFGEDRENEVSQLPIEVEVNVCERLSPFKDNLSTSSGNFGSHSSIPELQSPTPDNDDNLIASPKPEIEVDPPAKLPMFEDIEEDQMKPLEFEKEESTIPSDELLFAKGLQECPLTDVYPSETNTLIFTEVSFQNEEKSKEQDAFDARESLPVVSPTHNTVQSDLAKSPLKEMKPLDDPVLSPTQTLPTDESNYLIDVRMASPISSAVPETDSELTNTIKSPIASPIQETDPFCVDSSVKSPIASPVQETDPFCIDSSIKSPIASPVQETNPFCADSFIKSPIASPVQETVSFCVDSSIKSPITSPVQETDPFCADSSIKSPISSPVQKTDPFCADSSITSPIASPVQKTDPFCIDTSIKSPIASPIQETVQFINEAVSNSVTSTIEFSDELIKTDILEPVKSPEPPTDLPLTPTKAPTPQLQSPISPTPQPVEVPELDSPIEDITSSVKDSPVLLASPTDVCPVTETLSTAIHKSDLLVENVSPKSTIDTESVATTDVNSFLERSLVPEMASPLSGDDTRMLDISNSGMENVTALEIKTEIIEPEFPVQTVTTPSQESKSEDVPVEVAPTDLIAKAKEVVEKSKSTSAVTKKAPAKTSTSKPLAKPTPSTKSLPSKTTTTATKPASTRMTATSTVSKTLGAKPSPKDVKTTKVAEKKPMANGDAKPLTKKPAAAPRLAPITKAAPTKLSPTKVTSTATKVAPTTRTSSTKPSPKVPAAKPSPTTVKNVFERLATQTKAPITSVTKSAASTLAPKPKPTTIPPAKPKTLAPKPAASAPDATKQMKESTNKQLTSASANRLSSPAKPLTTTIRKVNAAKPATQAKASLDIKKPAELVRHSTTKPKTTVGAKKPATKTVTNGVTTKVSTTITTETKLIKDVSPIIEKKIVDNSQILEVNNTD